MFDALRLLDQFVGAGTAERLNQMTGGRLDQVVAGLQGQGQGQPPAEGADEAAQTEAQPGGLGGLIQQVQQSGLGGAVDQARTALQSGDVGALQAQAGQLIDQARQFVGQNAAGMLAGAALTGVAGLLLGTRSGRRIGGAALGLGGLALVGALSYRAYQNWAAGQAPTTAGAPPVEPAPADSGFANNQAPDAQERATIAIRAMISAAKADGVIDETERRRIMGRLAEAGVDDAGRAFLEQEMAAPLDLEALIQTATSVERAIELYAASVVAIDPDTDAERAYLDILAERLGLNADLRAHLDAEGSAIRAGG